MLEIYFITILILNVCGNKTLYLLSEERNIEPCIQTFLDDLTKTKRVNIFVSENDLPNIMFKYFPSLSLYRTMPNRLEFLLSTLDFNPSIYIIAARYEHVKRNFKHH